MIESNYLADAIKMFHQYKGLADRAIAQIPESALVAVPDERSNSIAVIMKHMAGNMRSRWTDFLEDDGEKPDRHRDSEFELDDNDTRDAIFAVWERGWQVLFGALDPLTADDLARPVLIRNEPPTVVEAINRQLTHYAYHVGQIVFLARHYSDKNWTSLSVPKGKSEEFNARMMGSKSA